MADDLIKLRNTVIILLMADAGIRLNELLTLTVDDIDLQRRVALLNGKGAKIRPVVFGVTTAAVLKRYLSLRAKVARCDKLLINTRTFTALRTSGVHSMLNRLKKKAGVTGRVNPHSFRHAFAREYLKNGGDVSILSTLMGHSDVNTTRDFYAVFKTDELADLHLKYSPIDHLENTQEEDNEHSLLESLGI